MQTPPPTSLESDNLTLTRPIIGLSQRRPGPNQALRMGVRTLRCGMLSGAGSKNCSRGVGSSNILPVLPSYMQTLATGVQGAASSVLQPQSLSPS